MFRAPHNVEQNRARFSWQGSFAKSGGGIYIASDGHASLIDSNVYENKAKGKYGYGGGLFIMGTAALTNVNLYQNRAKFVLCLSF